MNYDGDIHWYLTCLHRRRQLSRLEAMASLPNLSHKRRVRPRLGLLRRLWRLLTRTP